MKVFLSPTIALHSPAMVRIANALTNYAPPHYKIVSKREQADLCVFYPVSYEWTHYLKECEERRQEYALVQCCFKCNSSAEVQFDLWRPWWNKAIIVWSYLDLLPEIDTHGSLNACMVASQDADFNYYEAPLGIDEAFLLPVVTHPKRDYIVTTGTVHGKGAEAILECWEAARKCELSVIHVGQWPENIPSYYRENGDLFTWDDWVLCVQGVTDQTLRGIYQNAKYVCSLRYVEGFELPSLEALSCGTRSIVFTQTATTKWYYGYADFVPECEGQELVDHLVRKFSSPYESIPQSTIDEVRSKFSWGVLCWRFWSIVEKELSMKRQQTRKYSRGDGVNTCAECGIDIKKKRDGCTTCTVRLIENERLS